MLQAETDDRAFVDRHILFAEDDPDIGFIVTEMLRAEGFRVTFVESGDEAAILLETDTFHLLLTDVRMPGVKDGVDLALHARRIFPRLPVVIASGYAEKLGVRLARLERDVALINKPFLVTSLVSTIQNLLRNTETTEL